MSDQEFNFPTPPERREAKGFEPPPWEREAFEELARKKAEEQAEAEAAARVVQAAVEAAVTADAAEPPAAGPGAEMVPLISVPQVEEPDPAQPRNAAEPEAKAEGTPAKPGVDEAALLTMLADLRVEEEPMARAYTPIGLFATFVTALVGAVLLLWGVVQLAVAIRREMGVAATFGGLVLMMFGALFVALAFWVGARTLRQRGVI